MTESMQATTLSPAFSTLAEAEQYLQSNPNIWQLFHRLPKQMQEELLGFCVGERGLKITYDAVFNMLFNPHLHPERLEDLITISLCKEQTAMPLISSCANM